MTPDPQLNYIREELRRHLLELAAVNADAMVYYRWRWEEIPDDHPERGYSDWLFEVAPDGGVTRQMEIYDNGTVFRYHADHIEDVFGALTDATIDHTEYRPFLIAREEFETAWISHPRANGA